MASKNNSPRLPMWRWLAALCLCGGILPASAQWRTSADVRLTETYTDNVDLTPSDSARSDWVSEVTPTIRITGRGARSSADVIANVQNTLHANQTSDNRSSVGLNANGKLEAVENTVFVEGSAGITRQAVSLFGQSSANNYNGDNNTTEVRTATFNPYGIWHFGSTGVGELRYLANYTDSDSDALQNNLQQTVTGSLNNGAAWGRLGWGLSGTHTNGNTGDQTQAVSSSMYRGTLTYALTSDLQTNVFGGRESNNYTAQTLSYNNWGAGFTWTPSERTQAAAEISKRFFGTGYNYSIRHSFRHSAIDIGYSRDVSSVTQAQDGVTSLYNALYLLAQSQNPTFTSAQLNDLVLLTLATYGVSPFQAVQLNAVSSTYSIDRNLHAAYTLSGVRNTVTLTASRSDRQRIDSANTSSGSTNLTGDLATFTKTKETAINFSWVTRLSSLSSLTAVVGHINAQGDDGTGLDSTASHRTNNGLLLFDTRLGPYSTGNLTYRYTRSTGSTDYTENAVSASFAHSF